MLIASVLQKRGQLIAIIESILIQIFVAARQYLLAVVEELHEAAFSARILGCRSRHLS